MAEIEQVSSKVKNDLVLAEKENKNLNDVLEVDVDSNECPAVHTVEETNVSNNVEIPESKLGETIEIKINGSIQSSASGSGLDSGTNQPVTAGNDVSVLSLGEGSSNLNQIIPIELDAEYQRKRKLGISFNKLTGDQLDKVVRIVRRKEPSLRSGNPDELELDLSILKLSTIRELETYISSCLKKKRRLVSSCRHLKKRYPRGGKPRRHH